MSWLDRLATACRFRLIAVGAFATVLAGCEFQPMYAQTSQYGTGPSLNESLRDVEVAAISGRIGHELRNDLIFELTGGEAHRTDAPYRLTLAVDVGTFSPIIDSASGRPAASMMSFDVTYRLHDVVNNRIVLSDQAMARVSMDASGQFFANVRARRDAENRAARIVAEQIRSRLASYFLTRT